MIDQATIDSFDEQTRDVIKAVISTLTVTGVLLRQIEITQQNLLQGNDSEDPAELARKIIDLRKRNHLILELHQLGQYYTQENQANA